MSNDAQDRGQVLVVDDDAPTRMSLEGLLGFDYDVTVAASVAEARLRLAERSLDVVLTDYDMPGADGLELVDLINQDYPATRVLLLTGYADQPEVQRSEVARRIVRVISKPYDAKRLLAWVNSTVKLARMGRVTLRLAEQTEMMKQQR